MAKLNQLVNTKWRKGTDLIKFGDLVEREGLGIYCSILSFDTENRVLNGMEVILYDEDIEFFGDDLQIIVRNEILLLEVDND